MCIVNINPIKLNKKVRLFNKDLVEVSVPTAALFKISRNFTNYRCSGN
jgi:hypothetical protein